MEGEKKDSGPERMHKRIVEPVLATLDEERANYFSSIVEMMEEDRRTERFPNIVYMVLKETMRVLPVYLDKEKFIDLLFEFVAEKGRRLRRLLYDERFIHEPSSIRQVTDGFVALIVDVTFEKHHNGEIDDGERTVQRYTWPYRESDLIDPDEEDPQEVAPSHPPYGGPEWRGRG